MIDNPQPDSGRSSSILLHYAKTALLYEELRSAIDGGHESMTHADALAEISAIRAENETLSAGYAAARLEIASLRAAQQPGAAGLVGALEDAQPPIPSAAVALSDDLRDRLVAISGAIADQDDRAAQAMLREILAAPQPSSTPQADSVTAPATESYVQPVPDKCDRIAWRGHYYHLPLTPPAQPADSVLEDAARWQALPAFFEEYQIDAMKLCRDIDAYLAAARKQGGAT